jgi:flagellar basal-body rod modification protein FlgD
MSIVATDPTATSGAANAPAPANPKAQMGKDAFMKLLVAELKQQDPTDPVKAREMITQLSQLSSVEKLTAVEKDLSDMKAQNTGVASVQTAGLVGRTVTAETNRLALTPSGNATGQYVLGKNAADVKVTVRDAHNNVVRTLTDHNQALGAHSFVWDGIDDAGNRAPSAQYSFEVAATAGDASKSPVSVSTRLTGVVSQVSYANGEAELVVGDAHIGFGDVISISN